MKKIYSVQMEIKELSKKFGLKAEIDGDMLKFSKIGSKTEKEIETERIYDVVTEILYTYISGVNKEFDMEMEVDIKKKCW